eukprot:29888-Pelagococcus_subviridis.AAC.5
MGQPNNLPLLSYGLLLREPLTLPREMPSPVVVHRLIAVQNLVLRGRHFREIPLHLVVLHPLHAVVRVREKALPRPRVALLRLPPVGELPVRRRRQRQQRGDLLPYVQLRVLARERLLVPAVVPGVEVQRQRRDRGVRPLRERDQTLHRLQVLSRLLVVHGVRLRLRADLLARGALVDADGRDTDRPRRVADRDADVHVRSLAVVPRLHRLDHEKKRALDVAGELPAFDAFEQRLHVVPAQTHVRDLKLRLFRVDPLLRLRLELALPLLEEGFEVRSDLVDGREVGVDATLRDGGGGVFERRGELRVLFLRDLRHLACVVMNGAGRATTVDAEERFRFEKRRSACPSLTFVRRLVQIPLRRELLRRELRRGDPPLLLPLRVLLQRPKLRLLLVRLLPARVLVLHHDGSLHDVQASKTIELGLAEQRRRLPERSEASNRLRDVELLHVREVVVAFAGRVGGGLSRGGGAFVRVGGRANERVGRATSRRENAARTSAVSPPAGASPFFDVVVAAAAPLFSASASASPSEDVPAGGADRFAVASRFARRSSSSSIRSFASRTAVMCAFLTYFCPPNSSAFALRFLSSSALRRSILAGGTLGRARGRCGEIQTTMMRSVWSYTVMCSSHRSFKRHRGQLLKPWSG